MLKFMAVWLTTGLALFYGVPQPGEAIGLLMLALMALFFLWLLYSHTVGPVAKAKRVIYRALENGEVDHDGLVEKYGLSPLAVYAVLGIWLDKGWVAELTAPDSAKELRDQVLYCITLPGQVALGKRFGNS